MNICINSLDKAHFIIQSGSKAGELLSKFSRIVKFLKNSAIRRFGHSLLLSSPDMCPARRPLNKGAKI